MAAIKNLSNMNTLVILKLVINILMESKSLNIQLAYLFLIQI